MLLFLMWMSPHGGAVLGVGKGLFDNILRFKQNLLGGKRRRRRRQPPFQQRAPRTTCDLSFSGRHLREGHLRLPLPRLLRAQVRGELRAAVQQRLLPRGQFVSISRDGNIKSQWGWLDRTAKFEMKAKERGNKVVGAFTFSKVRETRNLRVQRLPHSGLLFD